MTNAEPPSSAGNAERRIEHATDAIRSMSHDLAAEVTPRPTWIERLSALTREDQVSRPPPETRSRHRVHWCARACPIRRFLLRPHLEEWRRSLRGRRALVRCRI